MRRSFYKKLTASYLVVITVVFTAGMIYLHFGLSAQLMEQAEENLARNARLARLQLVSSTSKDSPSYRLGELADEIDRALGVRVTVISAEGRLLADSGLAPGAPGDVDSRADRPEVIAAREKGIGTSVRESPRGDGDWLYLALPVDAGPISGGVIRLAMSLREIEETIGEMRGLLLVAGAFAFLLAIAVSFGAGVIARRGFDEIYDAGEKIARGDFSHRIASRRQDELGELARTMDRLASEVEGHLDELRNERDRLEAILEGMAEGVMVTNASGDILLVNSACREFFPSLPEFEDGAPIPLEAVRATEVQEAVRDMLSRSATRLEREVEVLPARTLALQAKRARAEGESNLVLVFHDVSEVKRLAGVRREFTANVSHELRTPLTAIQWAAQTLEVTAGSDPEATRRFASTINRHARRLSALVEDLLELGRIESKEEHVRLQEVSIRSAMDSAAHTLASVVEKRGVRLDMEIPKEADRVRADPAALERILINLAENGVNHSSEGSEITVSGHLREDGFVEVSVADQGEGIPPEHLPRIFERFYRVDSARSRENGGTGLGLSIVKHLVQEMGGDVWVESAPGRGSTFRFTVPTP
ncbi:MAG: HAMP domain-containing protein [Nitrospinae bacterium]|nr:HAMP domain-containing protein [Nitrospinota bacterium]